MEEYIKQELERFSKVLLSRIEELVQATTAEEKRLKEIILHLVRDESELLGLDVKSKSEKGIEREKELERIKRNFEKQYNYDSEVV